MKTFKLDHVDSPLGTILLVWDEEGRLRALDFADHEARMRRLLGRHYGAGAPREGRAPVGLTRALAAYFAGDLQALDGVSVRSNGTPFQETVWAMLRAVPAGTTTSYGALAAAMARPTAVRAVGLANGANPIVLVVPCHRVVGSDGSLTGYGGGLERKRWLLEHERRFATVARRVSA